MAVKRPKFYYQLKSDRFDTMYLFFYKKPDERYSQLFGSAYIKSLRQPVVWYVITDIQPEFSLN